MGVTDNHIYGSSNRADKSDETRIHRHHLLTGDSAIFQTPVAGTIGVGRRPKRIGNRGINGSLPTTRAIALTVYGWLGAYLVIHWVARTTIGSQYQYPKHHIGTS